MAQAGQARAETQRSIRSKGSASQTPMPVPVHIHSAADLTGPTSWSATSNSDVDLGMMNASNGDGNDVPHLLCKPFSLPVFLGLFFCVADGFGGVLRFSAYGFVCVTTRTHSPLSLRQRHSSHVKPHALTHLHLNRINIRIKIQETFC